MTASVDATLEAVVRNDRLVVVTMGDAMPVRYRIDEERRILFTEASGEIGEADLQRLWRAIRRDPKEQPDFNELHDYCGVTRVLASARWLTEFSLSFRRFDLQNRGAKIAIAAGSDEVFGLSRMTELLRTSSPPEFNVFRKMRLAREWLGLSPDEDEVDAVWTEP